MIRLVYVLGFTFYGFLIRPEIQEWYLDSFILADWLR
jgi:hypothetical protein